MSILSQAAAEDQLLYIGTGGEAIYSCTLNMETGALSEPKIAADAPKPGFLALHPSLPLLYTVTAEKADPAGGVRSFRINRAAGTLTALNQQPTGDNGATHLAVDHKGQTIVVAHYSGGSTAALPLAKDGSIEPKNGFIKHEGSSVNQSRQKEPHAHGVAIDQASKFACVADLGTDQIDVYRIGEGASLEKVSSWQAVPGAGPRHLTFHPNGKWLYSINELDNTIDALAFDDQQGKLTGLQTISTLPKDFAGESYTAEVVAHPNGKFLYGSNRGHDSTAVFSIDPDKGTLQLIQIEPTQGGHPRFVGIDPTGTFYIAANRDSNNLVTFRIDPKTGELKPTGHKATAPQPICIVFVK